jgi:ergothioneine biosynthesis protein EgtB
MAVAPTAMDFSLHHSRPGLTARYQQVRQRTCQLAAGLAAEDQVAQSMPDASPTKWHLAHTSWFFEQFLLKPQPDYRPFHPRFEYLFNSYYQTVGPMHQRAQRGLLTRPTVAEVMAYRRHVDDHMHHLLQRTDDPQIQARVILGLNHEQQHQELILTDIKHLFFCNPLLPAYRATPTALPSQRSAPTLTFTAHPGGVQEIGARGNAFCFDNETPRHRVLLQPHALADRLVSNGEYLDFIRDGGYARAQLWLSDGWALRCAQQWQRPLYWLESLEEQFTLNGVQALAAADPVSHLSFYEADAFARWAGARLPTESEWEHAAQSLPVRGNLLDSDALQTLPAPAQPGLKQMFGDAWEWTASAYDAYPGFRAGDDALGEYNGKFMCSQLVLRGGSCLTPADHVRASYRNFFYPHTRWQCAGLRLARDL